MEGSWSRDPMCGWWKWPRDGEMPAEHRDVLVLLPTRERLRLVVGVQATGHELFQQVCDLAGIREAHFFGLSVIRRKRQARCPLRGLPQGAVLRGKWKAYQVITKRGSAYILRHTPALHREQRGLSPKQAVLHFVREACRLEDVPVHFFRLYKDKKEDRPTIVLGLTLRGVQVYQEVNHAPQLLYDFPWHHVGKLAFLGKKFELWPDGLPAARKLVYRTGCPWRSRHLLRLLSASHQLRLALQPALQRLRQLEEAQEKKCYRESCIGDVLELELDLDPASRASPGSAGSGDSGDGGWRPPHRLSRLSSGSHCSSHSSGIEADSQLAGPVEPGEMSVDEPFVGAAALRGEEPPCISGTSQSSRGTVGGGRGGPEGDTRDQGEASPQQPLAVVRVTLVSTRGPSAEALHQVPEARAAAGPADPHSRSVDDVRPAPAPRSAPRPAPRSCPLRRALDPGPSRSVNSRSLDLLGEDQLPQEFVV
ncbi:FERM domain-containing protein 1 isoform 5-T6 [Megaptera novaeangliae]